MKKSTIKTTSFRLTGEAREAINIARRERESQSDTITRVMTAWNCLDPQAQYTGETRYLKERLLGEEK